MRAPARIREAELDDVVHGGARLDGVVRVHHRLDRHRVARVDDELRRLLGIEPAPLRGVQRRRQHVVFRAAGRGGHGTITLGLLERRELIRLLRERIAPLAAQVDETESYPAEQLRLLGAQGLMGLYVPEAYGGAGLGALAFCLAVEEIAWACASTAVIYLVQYAAGYPLVSHGTE